MTVERVKTELTILDLHGEHGRLVDPAVQGGEFGAVRVDVEAGDAGVYGAVVRGQERLPDQASERTRPRDLKPQTRGPGHLHLRNRRPRQTHLHRAHGKITRFRDK